MKRYQVIFFDAGYTLLYIHPSTGEVVAEICQSLGLSLDPVGVNKALRGVYRKAAGKVLQRGDHSTSPEKTKTFWFGVYERALMELGIRGNLTLCCEVLLTELQKSKYYRLFPDVIPTLRSLKEEGYGLGVISNFDPSLTVLLDDLGAADYLDHMFISSLVGFEKPDRRIFEVAIEATDLSPEVLVMVGDDPVMDVQPAQTVGMKGILLDRRNRYRKMGVFDQENGYSRIMDLLELRLLLE